MRATALFAVLLLATLAVASATTFYKEEFDSQTTQQIAAATADVQLARTRHTHAHIDIQCCQYADAVCHAAPLPSALSCWV